tara:strand:+ start:60 stop:263 length:204 start_codon:yes stop_codon:yes gene_type:complete
MAKRKARAAAISYLTQAARDMPDATPAQLRREIRRRLKRDGFGLSWIVVILKILAALAPLLFQRPKA